MNPISIEISKRLVGASKRRELKEKISSIVSKELGVRIKPTEVFIEEKQILISVSGSRRAILFLKKEGLSNIIYKTIGINKTIN